MKLPADKLTAMADPDFEYERFFSVSLDMLCISSYDGYFKKVNPAFEEVLGFTAEELCTTSYIEFIHPDDIERTTREVEAQFAEKRQVLNFENRYRCKDGSYKWLSWKSAPVGEFMYAVARDVTQSKLADAEIKAAKNALEVANRELESFSYSVAHDLRAPVRAILGFSNLIVEETHSALDPHVKLHLDRVVHAANRMGVLIDGLLNLSRLARQNLTNETVNLSTLAQDVLKDLREVEPTRKADFLIEPEVIVQGDPVLLKIVIANLLGNAWKYSSTAKHPVKIEFGSKNEDGRRVFFVRDNGAGFEMKYVNKLFGAFQRLHSWKEFEGTGIGLATVQRIIHRHEGHIWAQGEVNQGATFYFTIRS